MEEVSLMQQLRDMKVGQSLTFAYKRMYYVRNAVSYLNGCEENKRFASKASIKARTITVTRRA
jgi:hypothetical protein